MISIVHNTVKMLFKNIYKKRHRNYKKTPETINWGSLK